MSRLFIPDIRDFEMVVARGLAAGPQREYELHCPPEVYGAISEAGHRKMASSLPEEGDPPLAPRYGRTKLIADRSEPPASWRLLDEGGTELASGRIPSPGDEVLVWTAAYGLPGEHWCRITRIDESGTLGFPYFVEIPGGQAAQYAMHELREIRHREEGQDGLE
jgi:hypothetical protein